MHGLGSPSNMDNAHMDLRERLTQSQRLASDCLCAVNGRLEQYLERLE